MKKQIRFLTILLMTLLLAGCGTRTDQNISTSQETSSAESLYETQTTTVSESIGESLTAEASGETDSSGMDVGEGSDSTEEQELPEETNPETENTLPEDTLPEDGAYSSKEDVALYIHLYGHLPSNFITKKEAEKLGWSGGSLEPYATGKCIGGSRFGNYEGLLPEKEGRTYTECDIDTLGAEKRGAKRIVFSNDGLIYYTEDHYQSFELLYGEE